MKFQFTHFKWGRPLSSNQLTLGLHHQFLPPTRLLATLYHPLGVVIQRVFNKCAQKQQQQQNPKFISIKHQRNSLSPQRSLNWTINKRRYNQQHSREKVYMIAWQSLSQSQNNQEMKCEDVRMEFFCCCGIYTYLVQYARTDGKRYVRYFLFSVVKSMYCKREIKRTVKKKLF